MYLTSSNTLLVVLLARKVDCVLAIIMTGPAKEARLSRIDVRLGRVYAVIERRLALLDIQSDKALELAGQLAKERNLRLKLEQLPQ